MPGLVALMHPGGGVLQASPLWRRQMDGAWPDGDWRHGLDDESRFRLLQGLSAPHPFELTLSMYAGLPTERNYRCAAWWDATHQAHVCHLAEVTPMERLRREAEATTARIQRLFGQLPIKLAYHGPQPVGHCLFANRQYAEMFGLDERSIIGKTAVEIMGQQRVSNVVEMARAYYDTGEPVTFNYRLQNQGRDSIDLEVSMVMDTWPDGSERGTFVLITDITERRRAELALRKSEDRLSRFLEASAEGVIFQRAGLITDVNPAACRMLGVTDIRDLVGRPVLSVVSPDFVERARTVISSGADAFYETELVDAQGEVVPVELIGRMMEHNGERLRMTVIRDIRDRREAQARIHELIDDLRSQKDRAEAADRAKSVFLAAASHDLRQPIHALGLFLTALRAMAQAPAVSTADLAEICRRMQSSLDGLGQLLNMLLDVSRLDANAVQVERVPTPVSQVFTELDQDFAELALEKGLSLHVMSCSAWVDTDPTVLRRILSNLMSNAIRYTQRGRVLLGARPRGQQVEIQVWDSGIGIPPEQLDAIFEEFYQIGQTQARRDETHGLGLGLSIVQRSARLLDAHLRVCSHPGRGSMFSITLPRCEPPAAAAPARAPANTPTTPSAPLRSGARRVLVIDDEEQVLRAMQQLLEVWGHQVWCASSADEAVVLAIEHAHDIDLLISDYRLGGNTTAMHAISAVHACLPNPVPTYILTGDTSPQRIQEASDLGFPILHKPVDPNALRQALEARA